MTKYDQPGEPTGDSVFDEADRAVEAMSDAEVLEAAIEKKLTSVRRAMREIRSDLTHEYYEILKMRDEEGNI